ncbi:MAG: NAD(P)/FAD-dependent oxidoreductase [Candidatus Thorarchaeota archaeon]
MSYDVIVVGAGPAGSIAAYECARNGLKTLFLEKSQLPRDKPCGGAVMYRGLRLLNGDIPRALVEREIYGLRFEFSSGKHAEFQSDRLMGITVHRSLFDEFLTRRASDAGAELHENARVDGVSLHTDRVTVSLADGMDFDGSILIGADGVNTVVGRAVGLRPKRKDLTKVGLGMEADFYVGEAGVGKATNGKPSILQMLPVRGRLSYGWIFPKREHLAIGIAGGALHMFPLRPVFDTFYTELGQRLGVDLVPEKRRTHFLGGWGLHNKNVTQRVVLIGDAAGWVDPMMGEGIAYAMMSGMHAARIVTDAIEQGRYDEQFLEEYHHLCAKECAANFGMAAWAGSRSIAFVETLLSTISGHRLASDLMAMLARGEIGYSQIPSLVARRLPIEIPRMLRNVVLSKLGYIF